MSTPSFVSGNLDFHDLFHSPKSKIAAFAQMQVHLYRHDIKMQDYFLPLQSGTLTRARVGVRNQDFSIRLTNWAIQGVDKISQFRPRRKIKADVLFCPIAYFGRQTENRFLVRTLLGLAQTDAKIICLLSASAPCRDELDAQLRAVGRSGQITFVDPAIPSSPIEARLLSKTARMRACSTLEEVVQVLEPHGLSPGPEVMAGFQQAAYFVEAWERIAPWVEFDAVVARCHWNTLCSPVCRTGQQRGKPVITFQQGVIGHTLDAPVTASKYVAFGQSSASFLSRVNSRFFQAARMAEPPVEYLNGGCLFDTVTVLPDQFEHQTLLMVDVPNDFDDFYGVGRQSESLLQLAERLLAADLPLRRLVIRPHPYWSNLDFEACQRLVRQHFTRCELSHPVWSLEDDLRRSSAVVGIFSGVLTVASASGLPTIFLDTEQGYRTGDLACFSPEQTLLPDAAFYEIRRLLIDRHAYAEARSKALQNAREYYANGTNLELSGTFFDRLLRTAPTTKPAHNLK